MGRTSSRMIADIRPGPTGLEMDHLAAAMVRTIREPLLVLDESLTVLTANPAFYQTFQMSPQGVVGKVVWELGGHEWDIPDLREQLTGILEEGPPVNDFQVETSFRDIGDRVMLVNARRIQREGDDLILVAIDDVTEATHALREREHLVDALERSNKELERFAYVASHDLQEPLRMISSYTELLQRRYAGELDEKADKYIEYAADGARRMQAMISGLLEYSRIRRHDEEFEAVDLDEILDTVRRDLSVTLEEADASLTAEPLPTVKGDSTRLAQVFRNLLSNAIKFRNEEPPEIRITCEEDDACWRIGVHDNGIGIESDYFEQVFVVFKRLNTRRKYGGAGIGLALCRKIVEYHGGRMEVESEPGVGSTFYVILPMVEET